MQSQELPTLLSDMSLDQLAQQVQSLANVSNVIWHESHVKNFAKYSISKNSLCNRTNAVMNTYIANPDDENIQLLGNILVEKYEYAEAYLTKLQSELSAVIQMNHTYINNDRIKMEKILEKRSNIERRQDKHIRNIENESLVLIRINLLPNDLVNYIREYIPHTIILSVITIPQDTLFQKLNPLKRKVIKDIDTCMENNILPIRSQMNKLTGRDIIRYEEVNILYLRVNKQTKKGYIDRITHICYCYHIILNIVSKILDQSVIGYKEKDIELCTTMKTMLIKELTYIYKLMNLASSPDINKNAPKKRTIKPLPTNNINETNDQ